MITQKKASLTAKKKLRTKEGRKPVKRKHLPADNPTKSWKEASKNK